MAAMEALITHGIDFDCFEADDRMGGHWNTDYDCLHLITTRKGSGFRDHPMPEDLPAFPSRAQMLEYLEGYAEKNRLGERVTFGTRVKQLRPIGPGASDGWEVSTSNGATQRYAGVLVANGHNSVPFIPVVGGRFTGKTLHAADYSNPSDIEGRRVLVVGSGNSGCDIAAELAQAGYEVTMSIRKGHLFQPKSFFGKPRGDLAVMKLPPRILDLVLRVMIRIAVGRPEDYGLPTPATPSLNDQPPVVNSLVLHWVQHGRIRPVPGLRWFDGDTIETEEGQRHQIDTILWATGFQASLPFLPEELVQRKEGVPLRVAGCILPFGGPSRLYYVGLVAPRGPQLPVYNEQMSLIVDMLDLQERMDSSLADMFTEVERPEWRIDIVRSIWNDQMDSARQFVTALSAKLSARVGPVMVEDVDQIDRSSS